MPTAFLLVRCVERMRSSPKPSMRWHGLMPRWHGKPQPASRRDVLKPWRRQPLGVIMPRIWLSGPRILGGLIRPGISFNVNELHAKQLRFERGTRGRSMLRLEVMRLGRVNGENINQETADVIIDTEIERQRVARPAIPHWFWWMLYFASFVIIGELLLWHHGML